ncbi:hypothetical protein PLICRDRAFT_175632 [Plicaturopsis crispa FD-325 SS-3]|nr:hypothetical protein PLICRDRAFT_175632 [Plicaturopsis crispa FD-325 SS-3]
MSHFQPSAYQDGYISPQDLLLPRSDQQNWRFEAPRGHYTFAPNGIQVPARFDDPYNNVPIVPSQAQRHITPQDVLRGSSQPVPRPMNFPANSRRGPERRTERLPHSPQYSAGHDRCLSIVFSVGGVPGPRIKDVHLDRVALDSPHTRDLAGLGHRTMEWTINWPGYRCERPRISTRLPSGQYMTRTDLAKLVSLEILSFMQEVATKPIQPGFKKWKIGRDAIWISDVRLVALDLYNRTWVPELLISF